MKLTEATENDDDFAKRVHHESYKEMVLRQFAEWEVDVQDEYFKKSWDRLPHHIIFNEEMPCGYCSIEKSQGAIPLREIAILKNNQNRGIGTLLSS